MTEATDRNQSHDDAEEGGRDYRSPLEGYLESLLGEEAYGEFRDSRQQSYHWACLSPFGDRRWRDQDLRRADRP
jgi:hypothetical protein